MDLSFPETDPTPIFDHFRSLHATELLTAAVAHLGVFRHLSAGPMSATELRSRLALQERPYVVLMTALRAMGMVRAEDSGLLGLTPMAREHLVPGGPFDVSGYLGLGANNPSVLAMVERLRSNSPSGANTHTAGDPGTTHTFRDGIPSALDAETSARDSTLCLAGRARNVAPYLGARVRIPEARVLLDVGGGSGIYAYALLRTHPGLRAVILDRPEVLKVAEECAEEWQVRERVTFHPANLLEDAYPPADAVLFSNVLHDWDVPDCRRLVERGAGSLPKGGSLLIHDVFLNDAMDGPLPVALYSGLLFALSEGRAYSAAEYREWLRGAGLSPQAILPTLVHCGVLVGRKESSV
jgi:predicted O-methyltransferase YrrM